MSVQTQTGTIKVAPPRTAAALETMSRFAVDPRWLIYLPPTISPTRASEIPQPSWNTPKKPSTSTAQDGLTHVICEEKHMGSRGIIVLAKDQEAARRHFHIDDPNAGACYSRTGRRFFSNPDLEQTFLQRTRTTLSKAGIWDDLHTDWIVLDCEIMPWSLKAQNLLRRTYAPTGTAAINTLTKAQDIIAQAA